MSCHGGCLFGLQVRMAFMKIIVFMAHFSHQDAPFTLPPTFDPGKLSTLYRCASMIYYCTLNSSVAVEGTDATSSLSDYLILAVLNLRRRDVSEHGRHLVQYFHLFLMYLSLGVEEVSFVQVTDVTRIT